MVGVEQWAEIRRLHFVRRLSMREIHRRMGLHRDTISKAIHSDEPPVYRRSPSGSKLDPFKDEIHRLLQNDAAIPGQRIRELIAPLGFDGGKTIVDDYLRDVRPLFRPGADLSAHDLPARRDLASSTCGSPAMRSRSAMARRARATSSSRVLGYSRAGAGALIFSKKIPDLLFGIRRCLWSLGALPQTLVWDRQSGLHGGGGRPTAEFAAFCGALRVDWFFCEPRDPQAKGVVERLQDFLEHSFEPGRCFANEIDFQLQLDAWFTERANYRQHKTLRARPIDRLIEEQQVMTPLPAVGPDVDRRWATRVPPDPYLRFDTNDYSLDPTLVGRRIEVCVSDRAIRAVALDSGELACRHARSFAKHRTSPLLEHARRSMPSARNAAAAASPTCRSGRSPSMTS